MSTQQPEIQPLPKDNDLARVIRAVAADVVATEEAVIPADPASLTDAGNAALFAQLHGKRARYDCLRGTWMVFDGKRFTPDVTGRAMTMAKETAHVIIEAAKHTDGQTASKLLDHAKRTLSMRGLTSMLALAQSELPATPGCWDADPYLLNVLNGTLNLRNGDIHPHRSSDLLTQLAPVDWNFGVGSSLWTKFLNRTFDGDDALIDYVQRLLGYSLSGDVTAQIMAVFYGAGANGKSTLIDAIQYVMGDYAYIAPPDLLMQRGGDEHPTAIAGLQGKRLVIASETEKGRRLKMQSVKRLTGDATLTARYMRQDYFSFNRKFKLLMATNSKPRVDEDSEAVWRRLRLVLFNTVIPPEERDPKLLDKLKGEADGILVWLVEGFQKWQAHGLTEPAAVMNATEGYRVESDPLIGFIADSCTLRPDAFTLTADLRRAYELHCSESGSHPIGGNDFTEALKRHGLEPERRNRGRGWVGIALM